MAEIAWSYGGNGGLNQGCRRSEAAEFIGGKFENWNSTASEILLVADVLVGRDEEVELALRQSQ